MAILFHGVDHYQIADGVDLTLPDSDWCVGIWAKIDTTTGADSQYLISNNNFQAANSFNVFLLGPGQSNPNKIQLSIGGISPSTFVSAGAYGADGLDRLWIFQRSGNDLSIRSCVVNGSAVLEAIDTPVTWAAIDGGAWKIGARADLNAARYYYNTASGFFKIPAALSVGQIEALAAGDTIADLGFTSDVYLPMTTADATLVDQFGANDATRFGAPTTVADPVFPPPPSGLVATDLTNHKIYQRIAGAADIIFGGTTAGETPDHIQVQLYEADGVTVAQGWTTLTGATITATTWAGTLAVPEGGMYRFAARSVDVGDVVLATSTTSINLWGVGAIIHLAGSSSAVRWADAQSQTGLVANANVRRYNISDAWAAAGTVGSIITLANAYNDLTGVPVGFVESALNGTTVAQWSNNGSSQYVSFLADLANVGGKVETVLMFLGTNDAANTVIPSKEAHQTRWDAILTNIRTDTGQPNLPIFIGGTSGRTSANDEQFNWVREVEQEIEGRVPNTYFAGVTIDLEVSGDNVHLSTGVNGYRKSVERLQLGVLDILGTGTYHRSPYIVGFSATGTTGTVTVAQRGGTGLTVDAVHGFTATDDSGALPITSVTVGGTTTLDVVFSRPVDGLVTLGYGRGSRPFGTGQGVHDNAAEVLPLEIIEILAAEYGTAAYGKNGTPSGSALYGLGGIAGGTTIYEAG